jgi:hypothetical protein
MTVPPEFKTVEEVHQYTAEQARRDASSDPRVKRWTRAKLVVYVVLVVVLFIFYYRFDQLLAKLG